MPTKPRNRVGEIYGQLKVVRISNRRTAGGNAYWWCQCSCGNEREVPSDCLSNKIRKTKKNMTQCTECAHVLKSKNLSVKHKREEETRRKQALTTRMNLIEKIPEEWLKLPLTDSHARELGEKYFFRGIRCLKNHLSPYRINGGCLECAKEKSSRTFKL